MPKFGDGNDGVSCTSFLYFKQPYNLSSEKNLIIKYKGVMLVLKHKLGLSFAKVRAV